MFPLLESVVDALAESLERLDSEMLEGADAVELMVRFDRVARLAEAGRALCAARVEATGAWRRTGHRDAAGFIATRTGRHRSEAKDALSIGQRAMRSPSFGDAVRSGSLSSSQAAEIAEVIADRPEAEAELLGAAQTATMRELRGACAEVASRGLGAEQRHARASERRFCSSSVGRDGQWRLSAGLTLLDGALVDKVLDHFQNEVFDHARARGQREPFTAYRADALVRMAKAAMAGEAGQFEGAVGTRDSEGLDSEGEVGADGIQGPRRRRRGRPRTRSSSLRHAIIVTVPHTTFLTGDPVEGETCEVPGVGPVPVEHVRRLLEDDPIIKCVVTNGRDITATATMTRTIKEDLRLAVLHAHQHTCATPGCTNTRFVELDHRLEFADQGPTAYENLRPLCSHHHDQRTNERYELVGEPGAYRWLAPDGTWASPEIVESC